MFRPIIVAVSLSALMFFVGGYHVARNNNNIGFLFMDLGLDGLFVSIGVFCLLLVTFMPFAFGRSMHKYQLSDGPIWFWWNDNKKKLLHTFEGEQWAGQFNDMEKIQSPTTGYSWSGSNTMDMDGATQHLSVQVSMAPVNIKAILKEGYIVGKDEIFRLAVAECERVAREVFFNDDESQSVAAYTRAMHSRWEALNTKACHGDVRGNPMKVVLCHCDIVPLVKLPAPVVILNYQPAVQSA